MTTTQDIPLPAALANILVVEDSPTQAQYLVRLLQGTGGYRVRVAGDGLAALEQMRADCPDLVLSDIAMPRMDGYALCRAVKDDPALAHVPVVLLTNLSTLQDIVRSLEAGADAFLRKPYEPEELFARVRRLLEQRAAGDDRPLEFLAGERRRIYELLVATHEEALRLNEELAEQQAGLERMVGSLALLGSIAGALNEALTETAVADAALGRLLQLAALDGAALSTAGPDGLLRVVRSEGVAAAAAVCPECQGAGACATDGERRLCVPLMAGERKLGVLHLVCAADGLEEGERPLLDSVAKQVALALERADLYARLEALVVERTADLRSERNRLSAIVETAGALVLLMDAEGRIVMFNRACEETLGWAAQDAIGRPCWDVIRQADDPDAAHRLFDALVADRLPQPVQGEWVARDGSIRSILWNSTVLRREDGSVDYVLGTGIDITQLRGAEERLRYVSNFDTLTGLPNRQLLGERFGELETDALASNKPLGFLLLRFGRMALIRETLGPRAEQVLLQQAAGRLKELAGNDPVGRFSEGAFALAAVCEDIDAFSALARRLLAGLDPAYQFEGEELHLDPCIGIAVYPNDGRDFDVLAKGAEAAQRLAADGIGQRFAFYRPELNHGANDRFRLESALRRALERDELELHYQPQVDMTGQIVGAEALLRWRSPDRGLVSPSVFIGLAEESGLIMTIGEWALRQACAQLRAWQLAGIDPVPVSVNLSMLQFSDRIVPTLRRILDDYGVDPSLLELELTESASMADAGKSVALLAQLKAMGIRLAIDDFGTGYSNLNYLKRFPVDKLKLDQSFVRDILHDGEDLAISRAVIAMAHGLRLTVVAEGVENAGQLAVLEQLGCDLIQGWHYSRAVPADDFARLLRAGRLAGGAP
ncbi:EAL domain-containing protein [Massilia sp. YIM B02763]|uniref:GGDEF/EAL domain-containing response regulator n=1 Tax=Massilia sp. YIM B02763 TaxID=3050130 RepID=UPI0025B67B3F|nr:EAL domain-containing protein [Massilia sp. YIM B02763]MDN4053943.1 EAL domain-containing protein [Massilia sp. YIM B02763]